MSSESTGPERDRLEPAGPPDLLVREAVLTDADEIAEFQRQMALETEARALEPRSLLAGVESVLRERRKGYYLVAEIAGHPVAAVLVTYEWSDWRNATFWWIQSVYVQPGWRRRGVFREMYCEIWRRAVKDGGVCGLRLYVERDNPAARATYARLGMKESRYLMLEKPLDG